MHFEINQEELVELHNARNALCFNTRLGFLKQHNGLRSGCLHTFIATASGGKSTMRNSLIFDFVKFNPDKKLCLWLTEETENNFKTDLSKCKEGLPKFDNLFLLSELDEPWLFEDESKSFEVLESFVLENECDVLILDNSTSCAIAGENVSKQAAFYQKLKTLAAQNNICIIVFTHTSTEIVSGSHKLIDQNNVRGSRKIVILSEFLYVMQTFFINGTAKTTIRIAKHRGYVIDQRFFGLKFDQSKAQYVESVPVRWMDMKQFFKEQESLRG